MLFILNRISTFFLLIMICLAHASLFAQQEDSTILELDPVVVTGTRIQQQKSKIPASISVISRETIERSGQTNILPVLAREVPGLFLNARGVVGYGVGPNSGGNVSIRGISGSPKTRVLVLIDGQPQYMGIFGHPIADAYTASDIERVEVLKGAASLLYGSNAMGGAINLITRSAQQEGWHGSTHLAYGSFNTGKYAGTLRYKENKFDAFASINRERTDGFRQEGKDDFENTTGYLKLGYQLHEDLKISGDAQIADATYYHPGTVETPLEHHKRDYLRGRVAVSLENTHDQVEGALKLFYNFGDHAFSDGFRSHDVNRGITFYQNLKLLPDNIITLGIDYKNIGGKAENDSLPPPAKVGLDQRHLMHETDFYALLQHTFFDKLSVNGGIRLIQNSQFGFTSTPGAGLAYQIENTTLKASAHKAFRSPTIADLFLFPPANEELQPESLWNYELGFLQSLLNKKLSLEITGFISKGDNLIQVVPSAVPGPPQGRNTGSFSNQGIELLTNYLLHEDFKLMFNYTFLEASETVLFAPKHMLNFQMDYTHDKFNVLAGLQRVAGLNTSIESDIQKEYYTLLHARFHWKALDYLNVFIEGNNLLNTQYQIEYNYPMPGINVLGGIGFHF